MNAKQQQPGAPFFFYRVLEGMPNPRNPNEIGWRDHDVYEDKEEAIQAAGHLTYGQVHECRMIYSRTPDGTRRSK